MRSGLSSGVRRGAALIAAMLFLLPLTAWGQGEDPLDTVREANQRYDAGSFVDALRLYRIAYDQMDDARLLYRIGLSYEHVGNYQRAREFLEKYLQEDPESPVRGRVEANIASLQRLEENIQSFLEIETEPPGAEVFLYGYYGKAEGVAPVKLPVGAGENRVTLVFPEGQRLEVPVEVSAGRTEERFFQIGTATRPGAEVASLEETPLEAPQEVEEPQEAEEREQPEWGGEEEEEEEFAAQEEDVIPMPGSEPQQTRTIQLDYVDIGPPRLAIVSSVTLFALGNVLLFTGLVSAVGQSNDWEDTEDYNPGALIATGVLMNAGGFYLMGRKWRGRLAPAQAGRSGASTMVQLSLDF